VHSDEGWDMTGATFPGTPYPTSAPTSNANTNLKRLPHERGAGSWFDTLTMIPPRFAQVREPLSLTRSAPSINASSIFTRT
jgi:hypothetical protein